MLKLFFDGLCEPTNPGGVACYGFVVYEESSPEDRKVGEDYGFAAEPRPDTTHNLAEYSGLIEGLQWVRDNQRDRELKIFGDSQLVIRQITGVYKVRSARMAPLHTKTISILGDFHWTAKWVPRRENAVADKLSDKAYREYCMKKYGKVPPKMRRFEKALRNMA